MMNGKTLPAPPSSLLPVSDEELAALEKDLLSSERWTEAPGPVRQMAQKATDEGIPAGIVHSALRGWCILHSGQGPVLAWSEAGARGSHDWIELALTLLRQGQKFRQHSCRTCHVLRLEPVPLNDDRKWTFTSLLTDWDQVSPCQAIQETQAQARAAAVAAHEAAQRAAEEDLARRIAAGETIPTQAERIRAAIDAADQRADLRRQQHRARKPRP